MMKPTKVVVIGDATLYLGDCTEIIPTLSNVDSVITDPPYGLGVEYGTFVDTRENVTALAERWLPLCRELASCVAFTAGCGSDRCYPPPDHTAAWIMDAGGYHTAWGFGMWQPILCYGKDRYLTNGLGSRPDVIRTNATDRVDWGHPCPKPFKVWQQIVARFSLPTDTVLDPFMGSGTTGAVCANAGNRFIGIELEEKYFDIACKRIARASRERGLFAGGIIAKPLQQVLFGRGGAKRETRKENRK